MVTHTYTLELIEYRIMESKISKFTTVVQRYTTCGCLGRLSTLFVTILESIGRYTTHLRKSKSLSFNNPVNDIKITLSEPP